jgi:hypothetical protein
MITNILDRRTHSHLWRSIDAVAEATWHDNTRPDAGGHDNADPKASQALGDTFAVRCAISLAEAVVWAQGFPDEVTLYLYDVGDWEGAEVRPDLMS